LKVSTIQLATAPQRARVKNVAARPQIANTIGPVYSRGNRVTENYPDRAPQPPPSQPSTRNERRGDGSTRRFALD